MSLRAETRANSGAHRKHKQPPRILIVEDELLIALFIEEMVRKMGYRVSGIAYTIAMAHKAFARRNFEAVLLDVDLDGHDHPEVADLLLERGIPLAFLTGYDYLVEPRHDSVPLLQKPFRPAQLQIVLQVLVGFGSTGELGQ
jgi:DNA-binding response OmpR family regulator